MIFVVKEHLMDQLTYMHKLTYVIIQVSRGRFLNLGSDVTEFRKLPPYITVNYF